ncbi:MFS transporter [Collinsella stercoris]|uniref:MFS transporter n=1 Tax=Collinsella stercoris TaxID=147206 RepID=UPI003AF180CE
MSGASERFKGEEGHGGNALTARQWMALAGLTFSAFILNTSEFMPIGLLTDISAGFSITEATCGLMITAYAWAVMLLSLPLMIAASRVEFKRLLLGVLMVFAAGQVFSAVAQTFFLLVLARIVVASAHAIFWSIAAVMATRLVDVRHGSLAIGMIATGSSIAQIFGLPLGRAIGLALGWRMTFGVVGVIASAIIAYLAAVLPTIPTGKPFTLARLPHLFKNRPLVVMYGATMLFATGYYTCYSYIEPFLQQVASFDAGMITVSLTMFGVAGILGSMLFSRLYDGRSRLFLALSIAGVVAALALLRVVAGSVPAVLAVFMLWGCCGTAFNVAFQAEIIKGVEEDESSVAMSIFSGLFNFGIGAGSALGGVVVTSVSIEAIGLVGAVVVAVCWVVTVAVLFRLMRARAVA